MENLLAMAAGSAPMLEKGAGWTDDEEEEDDSAEPDSVLKSLSICVNCVC